MKLIPISKGKYYAQVDDEDFDMLSKNRWSLHKAPKNTYCIRQVMKESGKRETILMHRVIMGCKSGDGKMIDHKDHNGLNNQKSNLRFCSYAQNSMNRTPRGKSKYLGVWFSTSNKKYFVKSINDFRHTKGYSWAAQIVVNKKRICLGWFKNEEDAARAYDEAAKKHHGEKTKQIQSLQEEIALIKNNEKILAESNDNLREEMKKKEEEIKDLEDHIKGHRG